MLLKKVRILALLYPEVKANKVEITLSKYTVLFISKFVKEPELRGFFTTPSKNTADQIYMDGQVPFLEDSKTDRFLSDKDTTCKPSAQGVLSFLQNRKCEFSF